MIFATSQAQMLNETLHDSLFLPGFWMITGFGKLSENPQNSGHRDLRLHTHLAELVDLDEFPESLTHFTGQLKSAYLPVGEIARLPLQTVLRNGRTIQKRLAPAFECRETRSLDFNRSNITVFDRFGFDDQGKQIIPIPSRWVNQLQNPEMHGLFIGVGSLIDPYSVIIPTTEVFRFFYATSDVMAKALLRDDFLDPERNIWNPKKSALSDDGKALLWLRKRMLDADARFIARFAFDKYALHQAQQIFLYACNLVQNPHGERYIRALPPIEGEVPITYVGRHINTPSGRRTLVTRLLQCHWLPTFTHLKWDRDNDGRRDHVNREERDPVHWGPTLHASRSSEVDSDPIPPRLATQPPSALCAPSRLKEFEITERFPDLGAVPAEKLPQENAKTRADQKYWRPIMEEAFAGTVIEGKSSEELIGPTIIEGLEKKPPSTKEMTDAVDASFGASDYLTILNLLKAFAELGLAEVKFQGVLDSQTVAHGIVFNVYPEELDGKQKAWLYVNLEKTKRRMVLLAEITTEGKTRYVIELQQKSTSQSSTLVVWQRNEIRLAPGLLAQLLLDCARSGSATLESAHVLRVHWARLHHTIKEASQDSSSHFLKRIFAAQPKGHSNSDTGEQQK